MADKYTVKAARSGGKASIDAAMAAFAALAVGFAGYAMPADLFQRLFGPSAAADPASSARAIMAAGAAAATFALVFALLRALGRIPSGKRRKLAEISADPPRLRKADAHPDAPARWPVFARHELGDPIPAEQPEAEAAPEAVEEVAEQPQTAPKEIAEQPEPEAVEEAAVEEERALPGLLGAGLEISEGEPVERRQADEAELDHPLPSFIAPAEETTADDHEAAPTLVWDERAPPPIVEQIPAEPEQEPPLAAEDGPAAQAEEQTLAPVEAEPIAAAEPEPVAEIQWRAPEEAEPAAEEQSPELEVQPAVDELGQPADERQPDEAPLELLEPYEANEASPALAEAEPMAVEEQPSFHEAPTPAPEPVIEAAPIEAPRQEEPIEALASRLPELPAERDQSVSELMGRLEVGLGRSDRARWLGNSEPEAETPTEDRLRNAIGRLRKMARKS